MMGRGENIVAAHFTSITYKTGKEMKIGFADTVVVMAIAFGTGTAVADTIAGATAVSGADAAAGADADAHAVAANGGNQVSSTVNNNATSPSHIRVTSTPDITIVGPQATAGCVVPGTIGISGPGFSAGHSGGETDVICVGNEMFRVSSEEMARYSPEHRAELENDNMELHRELQAYQMARLDRLMRGSRQRTADNALRASASSVPAANTSPQPATDTSVTQAAIEAPTTAPEELPATDEQLLTSRTASLESSGPAVIQ